MKKTLIFILMILVLMVSSCNLFLTEEYGELILSFDGSLPDGARALGPDGLPILSTTNMKIDIIREDGYMVTRELSSEEPKSLIELMPIGEKIDIIVTAINPSGQWSGRASHTVTSGQNHVRVLLNKNISGLKSLLFTKTPDSSSSSVLLYNLSLYMGGKEVKIDEFEKVYSFARDSKGRLYVRYKKSGPPVVEHLARYTSEGEFDSTNTSASNIKFLANDYTTGRMYGINGSGNVYKIQETLSLSTSLIATLDFYQGIAAIDNNRAAWTWKDSDLEIKVDTLSGTSPSRTGPIHNHIDITGCKESTVNDLFIRGDYVYVLFTTVNESITSSDPNLYSLGGIVRYNINNLTAPPVKIGFSNSVSFENQLLKNYDYSKNFYGAVKVIGFDEENIYIADDGFDAAYFAENPHIVKNRNRIATLNIATNTLSFSDERTAKWYNEWKEWRTPNTKMIVWDYSGSSYYQVETGAEDPLPPAFATGLTDVFCYDAAGNLYVAKETPNAVHRFTLKDDGSYGSGVNKSISVMPDAMAVSVSSIAADAGKTILFYYQKPSSYLFKHKIERLAWPTDTFSYAATASAITLADLGQYDTVTAMAANKDGIFVAVKTVRDKDAHSEKYMIRVKKYAHKLLDYTASISADETVTVIDETSTNYPNVPPHSWTAEQANAYINENLNALYIKDGILYGLITKQKGAATGMGSYSTEVFIGGKLVKIGETGASFGSPAVTLYERTGLTPETSGRFAPYRFIAIKPKKLVIASKGYYGKLINNDNPVNPVTDKKTYKKVFVFDIGNWANPAETITQAGFSKDLYYSNGFYWY